MPPKPSPPAPRQGPRAQRAGTRHEREARRQRAVVLLTAATVGLAVFAMLVGLAYDQLWVPSRPVARVGDVTLTNADYWAERRRDHARTITQNLAFASFGPEFAAQFLGDIGRLDAEIDQLRTADVDDTVVNRWVDRLTLQHRR